MFGVLFYVSVKIESGQKFYSRLLFSRQNNKSLFKRVSEQQKHFFEDYEALNFVFRSCQSPHLHPSLSYYLSLSLPT